MDAGVFTETSPDKVTELYRSWFEIPVKFQFGVWTNSSAVYSCVYSCRNRATVFLLGNKMESSGLGLSKLIKALKSFI